MTLNEQRIVTQWIDKRWTLAEIINAARNEKIVAGQDELKQLFNKVRYNK